MHRFFGVKYRTLWGKRSERVNREPIRINNDSASRRDLRMPYFAHHDNEFDIAAEVIQFYPIHPKKLGN